MKEYKEHKIYAPFPLNKLVWANRDGAPQEVRLLSFEGKTDWKGNYEGFYEANLSPHSEEERTGYVLATNVYATMEEAKKAIK